MPPPPLKRWSMTKAFFVRFMARSRLNCRSEAPSIALMCKYPISPPLSLSTVARRSETHFSYLASPSADSLMGSRLTSQAPFLFGLSFSRKWNLRPAAWVRKCHWLSLLFNSWSSMERMKSPAWTFTYSLSAGPPFQIWPTR